MNIHANVYSFVFIQINKTLYLTSFTTGRFNTRRMKDRVNYQLSDMHAEVLSVKCILWIFSEIANVSLTNNSDWTSPMLKKTKSRIYKLGVNQDTQLFVYISKIPCGDCCIPRQFSSGSNFSKSWPINLVKKSIQQKLSIGKQLKGILDKETSIPQKGISRSKPFRKDLPASKMEIELSCSDKLMIYSVVGLNTGVVNSLFQPIYLSSLVLENVSNDALIDVKSGLSFSERYLDVSTTQLFSKDQVFQKGYQQIRVGSKVSKHYRLRDLKVLNIEQAKRYDDLELSSENDKARLTELQRCIYIKVFPHEELRIEGFKEELDPRTGMLKGTNIKSKKMNWVKCSSRLSNFKMNQTISQLKQFLLTNNRLSQGPATFSSEELQGLTNNADPQFSWDKSHSIRHFLIMNQMNLLIQKKDPKFNFDSEN